LTKIDLKNRPTQIHSNEVKPAYGNIVVLGAAGQLGIAVCQALSKLQIAYQAKTSTELNITDHNAVSQQLASIKPAIIINCAAYTNVALAEQEQTQCYAVNQHAVANLARCCKAQNALLIHFSTDYVFEGEKGSPYNEQDPPNPVNHYGASKLAGEQAIITADCQHYIIRTSWLYSTTGNNFYTTMQKLSKQPKTVRVVFDQLGAPTHVDELALLVTTLIQQYQSANALLNGIYHFCGDKTQSWYEFAQQIFKEAGSSTPLKAISTADYGADVKRPRDSRLNTSKIKNWLKSLPSLMLSNE